MLQSGEFKAKALEFEFGKADTGTEQVAVSCQLLEGPNQGKIVTWRGYFTDKTTERTLESLMHMGWNGESLERAKMKENGFGSKEFRVVLDEEEYQGEKKVKVQWINPEYGSAPMMKEKMSDGEQMGFAERMKGKLMDFKTKKGIKKQEEKEPWDKDGDEPFGNG